MTCSFPGEARQRITRHEADRQALAFAVALGCDEVDLANLPGKSSGQRFVETVGRATRGCRALRS